MKAVGIGQRLVPAMLVRNMGDTLAFYQKLGFQLTGCHPTQAAPSWAEGQDARPSLLIGGHP